MNTQDNYEEVMGPYNKQVYMYFVKHVDYATYLSVAFSSFQPLHRSHEDNVYNACSERKTM